MSVQILLMSSDPTSWKTKQVIIFDWYDGPLEGICVLADPMCAFAFKVCAARVEYELTDYRRLYQIQEIPIDSGDQFLALLYKDNLPIPTKPIQYLYQSGLTREKGEKYMAYIRANTVPIHLIVETEDFFTFGGCWIA